MSISDIRNKIKYTLQKIAIFMARKDTLLGIIILSTAISSYCLGVISSSADQNTHKIVFYQAQPQSPTKAISDTELGSVQSEEGLSQDVSTIFASRSGTKYYYSWCKSGNRIKPANRVYYDTREQVEATGKTLASGCRNK